MKYTRKEKIEAIGAAKKAFVSVMDEYGIDAYVINVCAECDKRNPFSAPCLHGTTANVIALISDLIQSFVSGREGGKKEEDKEFIIELLRLSFEAAVSVGSKSNEDEDEELTSKRMKEEVLKIFAKTLSGEDDNE